MSNKMSIEEARNLLGLKKPQNPVKKSPGAPKAQKELFALEKREFGVQIIYGNAPSKSNCYKIIKIRSKKGEHYSLGKTGDLKDYEASFAMQCHKYRNANIRGFFEFHLRVFYPSNRSDLDNSLKCILDCLQSDDIKAIQNDNRCIKIVAEKHIDNTLPRIEFKIIEL